MFTKILIANRGEIACRVMETAAKLGVGTVAVYSDADANAKHVAMADEAVHIGGSAPADSYLRGDVIIAAALAKGAQAIHPGYGFLSENPDFVEQCEQAGLRFIGPSAEAIRAMGLKDAAKVLMQKAGVPVVPGYHGEDQDPAHLAAEAEKIGYPVLIKAVAGGGGKGMRLVENAADFPQGLDAAKAEALNAFGNDVVLIEKYIRKPRHIEVQVFGDGKHAVHLFERDCSLQRRHQKVIEEAPAPGMSDKVRAAMGAAAVKAAEAIGYAGAGTIEFIVDGSDGLREDGFWFMEMNTRLQVEHPVTEAITGVDLVEWQLHVASGQPLPATQDQLSIDGHSFEARLYAEDVPAGFLPATGTLTHLSFPAAARADSGVRSGDQISPFYDPMIAKLTVHGRTREHALARLVQVLGQTEVAGSVTNLAFLRALALHQGFAAGQVDTDLIARDLDNLVQEPQLTNALIALAALGAVGLHQSDASGFALWQPLLQTVQLRHGEDDISAKIATLGAGRFDVSLNDQVLHVVHEDQWQVDDEVVVANVLALEGHVSVFANHGFHFEVIDPLQSDASHAGDGNLIEAPMPGSVKAVFAKPGQVVAKGDRLAILEAMKMEHALLAARDGEVAEVLVAEGDQVEAGAPLIQLQEEQA
ncbi:MAG: 3-methylcrotonyl-CoA carboxylase [Rhodobacterales bacterium]|nr:MAG: 3-methylcrotonyl-CoA carboxylase [Rhodobacterales bacterium]